MYKLMKNKGKEMSDDKATAKMEAIKDLRAMANDMIGQDLGDLKKVTVASDSTEGLEAGLDKAEEIVAEAEDEEDPMGEGDSYKEEDYENDTMSSIMDMYQSMGDEEKAKLLEMLKSY